MYKRYIFLLLLCLSGPIIAAKPGELSYERVYQDSNIEDEVDEFAHQIVKKPDTYNIKVKVHNGYVLLYGTSPSQQYMDQIVNKAENADNVHQVFNQIEINQDPHLDHLGSFLLDAKIKSAVVTSKDLDASKIRYAVYKKTVYLMGHISPQEAAKVVDILKDISSIRRIVTLFEYNS